APAAGGRSGAWRACTCAMCASRPAGGPIARSLEKGSRRSRRSCTRSTTPGGAGSTTSKSSRTTARSAPRTRTRCGLAIRKRSLRRRLQPSSGSGKVHLSTATWRSDMTRLRFRAGLVLLAVAAALVAYAATAAAHTSSPGASPIVIGWAFDSKGAMAPFDNPALAAAKLRLKYWNAKGGVGGRQIVLKTCDTQGNKAPIAKACALKLLGQGANVMFTTCDVDLAAPVVQEAIHRGV